MRVCIYMREYMSSIYVLNFSLEFFASDLRFPQHPKSPLSQHQTKWFGISAWHMLP